MTLPARTAVIDPDEPNKVIYLQGGFAPLPALNNVLGETNAAFAWATVGDRPVLNVDQFATLASATAVCSYGFDEGAFGKETLGPAEDLNGNRADFYIANGTIFSDMFLSQTDTAEITFNFAAYPFDGFTGGETTGVYPSVNIGVTYTFAGPIGSSGGYNHFVLPSPDSTDEAPEVYMVAPTYGTGWPDIPMGGTTNYYCVYKIHADGTVGLAGTAFYGTALIGFDVGCVDDDDPSLYYGFGYSFDNADSSEFYGFTIFTPGTFNLTFGSSTWDFTQYQAATDNSEINDQFDIGANGYNTLRMVGTANGFLMEYLDAEAAKKLVLFSKDWTTYSFVTLSGVDVAAQALIDSWTASEFELSTLNTQYGTYFSSDADGVMYMAYGPTGTPAYAYGGFTDPGAGGGGPGRGYGYAQMLRAA